MNEAKIPAYKLQDCLKYHAGSAMRTKLLKEAYAIDFGRMDHDDIAGMILDALNAGARTAIYLEKRSVYCE